MTRKVRFITSGVRIGTPAVTTRASWKKIWLKSDNLIRLATNDFQKQGRRDTRPVAELCKAHPLLLKYGAPLRGL